MSDQVSKILATLGNEYDMLMAVLNAARNAVDTLADHDLEGALDTLADAVDDYDCIFGEHEPSSCADCGTDTTPWGHGRPTGTHEYYMVRDDLWKAATRDKPARFLCIGCLETRIDRKLCCGDFIDAPINDATDGLHSDRLRQRLAALRY